MFTRITATFVAFIVLADIASAQGVTPQQAEQAMTKIRPAILSHPEPLVREKLLEWLQTSSVLFAANNILPEMSSSLEQIKGKGQVLLWYNTTFVLQVPDVNPVDKQAYLWLVLYHEAVHIDDHFSGRMPLGPLIAVGPVSEEWIARDMWEKEWSAVSKEWVLAKKLQKPYLVPEIALATLKGENPRTFLEGFYRLQMAGNAVAANPALAAGFTSRYRQELAKLSTR